jgi:hypothetical protein
MFVGANCQGRISDGDVFRNSELRANIEKYSEGFPHTSSFYRKK